MSDTPALAVFNRVIDMVAEFIDWIGGRDPLAIPRAFYRNSQRHLCMIEDMLRGALCILALDITPAPQGAKPAPRQPKASPALARKAPASVGLFNIRPVSDPASATVPTGPHKLALRSIKQKPDAITDAFLRRIARIEAAMADPQRHAARMARFLNAPQGPVTPATRPAGTPRPPSKSISAPPRSILSLQPARPPG